MVRQVRLHLGDELGVVGAVGVEPEHRGVAGGACTRHRKFHPVLDGRVLDLAHAEDVARLHALGHEHLASGVGHFHRAGVGNLEGLVVRTVFLRLLGHQPDVGHGAHDGRVEGAVALAEVDGRLVHPGVRAVRDDGHRVLGFALGVPHLAAFADHGRHGGVDDHVGWHVQVGDAFVGIDHGQRRTRSERLGQGGFNRGPVCLRHAGQLGHQISKAVVEVHPSGLQGGAMLVEHRLEKGAHGGPKQNGVGHLHHGGLHVQRVQRAVGLDAVDLVGQERFKLGHGHGGAIDDFSFLQRQASFQDSPGAVFGDVHDVGCRGGRQGDALF